MWIFGGDNTASEILPYNGTMLAGRHGAVVATVSGLPNMAAGTRDRDGLVPHAQRVSEY